MFYITPADEHGKPETIDSQSKPEAVDRIVCTFDALGPIASTRSTTTSFIIGKIRNDSNTA